MTEEIVVNGFNVSECYADNKMMKDGLYCFWEGGNCEDNEYCYYKECKRLEQENKQAHEDFICSDTALRIANTELDELKQENERLQSEIRQKKMTIMMNNDHYLTVDENNRKYRSALEEIRVIAHESYYMCDNCEQQRKEENCNDKCNAYRLKEIRDKIEEVLK